MIGGGVAVSLARSGHPAVAVYDVRADAVDGLEGVPACVSSPAEVAAQADVVLLAVVDADQARDVLQQVLPSTRIGTTLVLLSTVSLAAVRELSERCTQHGVTLLDAGVTNGPEASKNGLVTMVGGPDDAVARAMPVLEAFSKAVVHCGPLGAGMTTKLARNAITYAMWAAVREATGLAAAGGVPPQTLLHVLEKADDAVSPLLHLQLKAVDYTIAEEQQAWASGLADKDLAAAQELAGELGLALPITDQVRPRMADVYAGRLDAPDHR
jgi:3-hydroxyisobutyrate dehydrogenase-like beta-hydroxyacid dehydrogenase